MSDRNNDQELEKTTDATADEATSETETNDAIESVPADSMQFSVTFDDVDDEGTVDDGIYSALASAETGETDETNEAEADAIASANASAEVTERNAARVNETLRLAKTDHKDALAEHAEPQGKASEPTMTLASRIDRVLVGGGSDDILLKTYPTFALNKVTVAGPKGKVNILDGANFFCYSGHAYALLISDDPDSGITADAKRRALMGVMSGLTTPASGTVMNKSANIVELEPVELRGHRLGIVPQLHAVQPKIDAEQNVLYAMNASNRNFLKPKPVIARELLAKVGFSEATSGVAVGTLPLVQQRLVAIARAISTEAEVLILDEPTRGLNADDEVTVFAALAKLAVAPTDTLWDVGAGTGSVSVEMALAAPMGQVYAVECDADACALVRQNQAKFAASNLTLIAGKAPEALQNLPAPDAVFIGGSKGNMQAIVDAALAANPQTRLCIAAIALETLQQSIAALAAHGLAAQVTQIAVSRSKAAGSLHLMMANNPVFLIVRE